MANYRIKKRSHEEDTLQEWLARWLNKQKILYTASCAGMKTKLSIGARMKRMGAKKGFPDILILEPTSKYHGLFLELKSKTGSATTEQEEWRDELNKRGYCALIMPSGLDFEHGLQWCKEAILFYLSEK